MITLNLLQLLQENGFGTIDVDLFWNKLSLNKNGVFIVDIGQAQPRGNRRVQRYELYSRSKKSDVDGYQKLKAIADFLNDSAYSICDLPKCNKVKDNEAVHNVTIMPVSTPTNTGEDSQERIVWAISGNIIY